MPLLLLLSTIFSLFLQYLVFTYVNYKTSFLTYIAFLFSLLNLLVNYTWFVYPNLTKYIIYFSMMNGLVLFFVFLLIYEAIHSFIILLFILNFLSYILFFIISLRSYHVQGLTASISKYRKIFLYSHLPIVIGFFSFLLVFVNDVEEVDLHPTDWRYLFEEEFPLEEDMEPKLVLTKDFGFIKKIELKNVKSENFLSKLFSEKNLCDRKPNFCKRFHYVRFYY